MLAFVMSGDESNDAMFAGNRKMLKYRRYHLVNKAGPEKGEETERKILRQICRRGRNRQSPLPLLVSVIFLSFLPSAKPQS